MDQTIIRRAGENWGTTNIEVQINGTGGTYSLPDDSILREKRILGMFVPDNVDDSADSPTGRPLVSNAAIRSSYITLKQNNDEVIMDHPLSDFLLQAGDRTIRQLNMCSMNPQKSEITVSDTSLITSGESIILQFIYEK